MIAKILPIFVLLVVSHQASVEKAPQDAAAPETPKEVEEKPVPMAGIDPNQAACDPHGKIFLLLPHYTDCSKFMMCVHGQEVEFSCAPGGLYFDFGLQTCNWAWSTKCMLRTLPAEEIEGSGEDGFRWLSDHAESQSAAVGTLTGDEVANNVRPTSLEYSGPNYNGALNCLRADSASRMMPYKGDCQRYWHCVNGVATTAYCSDGLFFNDRTEQCDFEANVKCMVEQEDELKSEFLYEKK